MHRFVPIVQRVFIQRWQRRHLASVVVLGRFNPLSARQAAQAALLVLTRRQLAQPLALHAPLVPIALQRVCHLPPLALLACIQQLHRPLPAHRVPRASTHRHLAPPSACLASGEPFQLRRHLHPVEAVLRVNTLILMEQLLALHAKQELFWLFRACRMRQPANSAPWGSLSC